MLPFRVRRTLYLDHVKFISKLYQAHMKAKFLFRKYTILGATMKKNTEVVRGRTQVVIWECKPEKRCFCLSMVNENTASKILAKSTLGGGIGSYGETMWTRRAKFVLFSGHVFGSFYYKWLNIWKNATSLTLDIDNVLIPMSLRKQWQSSVIEPGWTCVTRSWSNQSVYGVDRHTLLGEQSGTVGGFPSDDERAIQSKGR